MPRKPHTKSRNGCAECKRRHIKCDETRPSCVNCATASLHCIFLTNAIARHARVSANRGVEGSAISESPTSTLDGSYVDGDSHTNRPFLQSSDHVLNFDHIEFLHHFCTVTYATLTPEPAQQYLWQSTAIKIGLSFPFLMHQILAIAALHLGHCNPSRQEYCSIKATELQSCALGGFSDIQNNVDASSAAAAFLFASLLALQVLADPTRSRNLDFSEYIDHLLSCMNLMRGVRQLVMADWWHFLLTESELKPLFNVVEPQQPYDIPDECRELVNLTHNADLSEATVKAYEHAIERLQFTFALSGVPSQRSSTIRWLLAWPLQLREDYMELLNQRRPEALIILAYYGVLMHFYRESWAVGNSGAFLIRAINAHTGRHWERWLAWPNGMIESTQRSPT